MCITSCKQRSATHKLTMVNLWPNLTAYQSVSFFLSPFARLFIFPFATFRCGPIKKIALTARKSLCSFANGRSGFPLVAVHPLCQLRKRSRTSLLPAEIFSILHDFSKLYGNIRNASGSNLTIVRNLTTSVHLVNL